MLYVRYNTLVDVRIMCLRSTQPRPTHNSGPPDIFLELSNILVGNQEAKRKLKKGNINIYIRKICTIPFRFVLIVTLSFVYITVHVWLCVGACVNGSHEYERVTVYNVSIKIYCEID